MNDCLTQNKKHISDIKTSKSYSERGFCVVPVCGVRCDKTEVGRWVRPWRCRGWTEGTTWWASEVGCCGGVPAGRGCGGSGHTGPAGRGRP